MFMLLLNAVYHKYELPYAWHSYWSLPLFQDRQWYRHPTYGPMVIERKELQFIEQVCRDIRSAGGQLELLSTTYSYANYFCDIPPWHDYVQTFFDTTSSATIFGLMDELKQNPPQWILYQRQINNLVIHEQTYNHGQPLPHRFLDQLVMQKISQGEWHVVYTSSYGENSVWDNHWLLIRTR